MTNLSQNNPRPVPYFQSALLPCPVIHQITRSGFLSPWEPYACSCHICHVQCSRYSRCLSRGLSRTRCCINMWEKVKWEGGKEGGERGRIGLWLVCYLFVQVLYKYLLCTSLCPKFSNLRQYTFIISQSL